MLRDDPYNPTRFVLDFDATNKGIARGEYIFDVPNDRHIRLEIDNPGAGPACTPIYFTPDAPFEGGKQYYAGSVTIVLDDNCASEVFSGA